MNKKHSGNRAMSFSVLLIPARKKSWLKQCEAKERFVLIDKSIRFNVGIVN